MTDRPKRQRAHYVNAEHTVIRAAKAANSRGATLEVAWTIKDGLRVIEVKKKEVRRAAPV